MAHVAFYRFKPAHLYVHFQMNSHNDVARDGSDLPLFPHRNEILIYIFFSFCFEMYIDYSLAHYAHQAKQISIVLDCNEMIFIEYKYMVYNNNSYPSLAALNTY